MRLPDDDPSEVQPGVGIFLQGSQFAIRKNSFIERVVKHWSRLPREVMELSSLEMLKKKSGQALWDMV